MHLSTTVPECPTFSRASNHREYEAAMAAACQNISAKWCLSPNAKPMPRFPNQRGPWATSGQRFADRTDWPQRRLKYRCRSAETTLHLVRMSRCRCSQNRQQRSRIRGQRPHALPLIGSR